MKLPWQKSQDDQAASADALSSDAVDTPTPAQQPKGYTAPKGQPTPKRRDQERAAGVRSGPVAPPPRSGKEARARRKAEKQTLSKEEYKEARRREREAGRSARAVAQEKMMSGQEAFLLDRDKGPVKKWTRDWVDSKRFLSNYFMPMALVLLVVMFVATLSPQLMLIPQYIAMVLVLVMFVEGTFIGVRANNAAKRHFGEDHPETGFKLGWYAYSRASQPRKLRAPRPQVEIGTPIE